MTMTDPIADMLEEAKPLLPEAGEPLQKMGFSVQVISHML